MKGTLAAGLAVSFGIEAAGVAQIHVVAVHFAFQFAGLVGMTIVCAAGIHDTNYTKEINVIPPMAVQNLRIQP